LGGVRVVVVGRFSNFFHLCFLWKKKKGGGGGGGELQVAFCWPEGSLHFLQNTRVLGCV